MDEKTFEMAVNLVAQMLAEDRRPTYEEKLLLMKMVSTVFFDLHSVADSLKRIAAAVEGLDMSAANGVGQAHRG